MNLNKKTVTKEGLLVHIQDVDVYRFYTGKEVVLKKQMLSPLRKEKKPSFGYFENNKTGEIMFKDFNFASGDFVKFVELLFGLNFFEALSKIAIDFNLTYFFYVKDVEKTSKNYDPSKFSEREKLLAKSNSVTIGRKVRDWNINDRAYWQSYGITKEILMHYNVEPISYFFLNHQPILADKLAYCYKETKDDNATYKIYQPYNEKYKWLTSHDSSTWQGWTQMDEINDVLIITSSLKDVMSIKSTYKYTYGMDDAPMNVVALQNEGIMPKKSVVKELKERFNNIYLLYDNDAEKEINWGQQHGRNICDEYNFYQIEIPEEYEAKDYSDLVKKVGADEASKILNEIILSYLPF